MTNALARQNLSRLHSILRKLRLIARSDLASFDKLRYLARFSRRGTGVRTYRMRSGISVRLRDGTTDSKVFDEIFVEHAYGQCAGLLAR